MQAIIRGRFAPSPSGRMHLGNVFCALMAWLSCRAQRGRMLLRIEDLDPDRSRMEYARLLEDDLRWLGLDWDEGGLEAPGGPCLQSRRLDAYARALERLQKTGDVYPCFCTRAELHAAQAPHASDGSALYSGRCRRLTQAERADLLQQRAPALRLRLPDERVSYEDLICGLVTQNLAQECGDIIIRRRDGVFAYQLAVVVDDGEMGVTEVIRGRDLLSSTPRQVFLHRLLGQTPPQFGHVPLLVAPDGRRLSKREMDLDMGALRQIYPSPQPILGRLAFLAGLTDRPEGLSAQDLIPLYRPDALAKDNIIIDPQDWRRL